VKFWYSPRFSGSYHGLDQRSLLVKPWCVLVLRRGVSEDFLVAWWRRSNRPLWTAGFRAVSAIVGACVLSLLVVFVPRTSSTPVATWFWQTEGRSAERVILGVRPSEFILLEFQSLSRRIFIGSHSLPPLWSPDRSFGSAFAAKRSLCFSTR
jgi:hypothetical protein